MPVELDTAAIVDILSDVRVLPREQFDELIASLPSACNDWSILCRECVYRGWLTPFQGRRLLQGRGRELVIGNYVLLDPVGEGGMGRVYRARNWKLGTFAAVKVVHPHQADKPAAVERFFREVRASAAVSHPHLVRAIDADRDLGRLYFAMEYVQGTDLGELLETGGPLPVEVACKYAAQLASALGHVSALGLVHRDLKPGNVLVAEDGASVKLADLGLARFDARDGDLTPSELTQRGLLVGTPDYAAPEQLRDARSADIRSDLYSLGCTFYHMLAGRPPFEGGAMIDKVCRHQTEEPTPVEELRPDVPPIIAAAVRKLLQKRPRDRHQDPAELESDLRPYLMSFADTITDAAAPTSPGYPSPSRGLPPTVEIPVESLMLITEDIPDTQLLPPRQSWLVRGHLFIAISLAAAAMAAVVALR